MDTAEIISIILVTLSILYLFILLIIAQFRYSMYRDEMKKEMPGFGDKFGGGWVAGTYWFRWPLPIMSKSDNEKIKSSADSYDRIIKIYWISCLVVLPAVIIILNLIN